jgi:hypothetical protein
LSRASQGTIIGHALAALRELEAKPLRTVELAERLGMAVQSVKELLATLRRIGPDHGFALISERRRRLPGLRGRERYHSIVRAAPEVQDDGWNRRRS